MKRLQTSGGRICSPVMLVLAMAALGTAARAGVITEITTVDNLVGGNATYGYNWPMLGTGYHATGGCPAEPAGASCTATYLGTVNTGGNLTSVSQSVVMTGATAASNVPPIPAYAANANALANANLLSATVGVAAGGDYLDYRFPESGQGGGYGNSFAQVNDTLHFNIAGANGSTVTNITVTFTVNGGITVPTPAGDSNGSLRSILTLGSAGEETDVNSTVNTSYSPVLVPVAPSTNGWVSQQVTGNTGHFVFTGVYAITGSHADLGIAATLSDQCGLGTSCDYSHTGTVSFGLATNVSYTSDAGFLSQQPSSGVPEPGSVAMMAAAMGALAILRRRRLPA